MWTLESVEASMKWYLPMSSGGCERSGGNDVDGEYRVVVSSVVGMLVALAWTSAGAISVVVGAPFRLQRALGSP